MTVLKKGRGKGGRKKSEREEKMEQSRTKPLESCPTLVPLTLHVTFCHCTLSYLFAVGPLEVPFSITQYNYQGLLR